MNGITVCPRPIFVPEAMFRFILKKESIEEAEFIRYGKGDSIVFAGPRICRESDLLVPFV